MTANVNKEILSTIRLISSDEEELGYRKEAVLRRLGWECSSSYPDHCWRWSKVFDGKAVTGTADQAFAMEWRLAPSEEDEE